MASSVADNVLKMYTYHFIPYNNLMNYTLKGPFFIPYNNSMKYILDGDTKS